MIQLQSEANDGATLSNAAVIGVVTGAAVVLVVFVIGIIAVIRNRAGQGGDIEELDGDQTDVTTVTLDDDIFEEKSEGNNEAFISHFTMDDDLDVICSDMSDGDPIYI